MRRLAVIGCGNMGSAIVRGLLRAGWTTPDLVTVTNPSTAKCEALADQLGVAATTDNAAAARGADVVLLGVKPQIIRVALADLDAPRADQVVISIAAGISTAHIEAHTGDAPVVRAMPNLGVIVAAGATAVCAGRHARPEHVALAREVFESVGTVESVPEDLMDAVTGLSGTGPMYVFQLLEALADAGVKVGLSRAVATRLGLQTVLGSAQLAKQQGLHPAALKDLVTSPGGTAIAALHVLRRNAFEAIVMDAVEAATHRAQELGQ